MNDTGLRVAFAGTPELAAIVLDDLLHQNSHTITHVYTQPDRPAGRGRKLKPSAVKQLAQEKGLEVRQPATATELASDSCLSETDVMLVVAYGVIVPDQVLQAPKYGCINIHTSLLPRWRGAAPIQRAIEAGDTESGITIMQMDSGVDTGDILFQQSTPIEADDTAGKLHDRLAGIACTCIRQVLDKLADNKIIPVKQDETLATYADKISKQEAMIDWSLSATRIERKIRAFNPIPVAWSNLAGQTFRIWNANVFPQHDNTREAGTILDYSEQGLDVACQGSVLRITRLQIEGKKPQAIAEFYRGHAHLFQP